MKVILLADIARLGRKHDVKDVPDGHAHNYLIPRRLALPATPENMRRHESERARRQAADDSASEAFAAFLARAEAEPIEIEARANAHGHLFKGFRADDIAEIISKKAGITLDAEAVNLVHPIKEAGEHTAQVRLGAREGTVHILVKSA